MDQCEQDFLVIKKKLQLYGCHQLTVQFFQIFWRWPCFAVRPFSQSTSRVTSSFGFAWLGRSGWRTQTTQDLWQDLWPCQLEMVVLRDLQGFCCHAHRRSFLLSTAPSPRSTLGSRHSNTQNLQCLWHQRSCPISLQAIGWIYESPRHPNKRTTTPLRHYPSGQTKPSCKGIFQHLALSLGLYQPGPPAEFQDSAFDIPVLIKFQQTWGTWKARAFSIFSPDSTASSLRQCCIPLFRTAGCSSKSWAKLSTPRFHSSFYYIGRTTDKLTTYDKASSHRPNGTIYDPC